MFTIEGLDGFDKLQKKLEDLSNSARNLHGNHEVPIKELLNGAFLSAHTHFSSADELFEKSGFKIDSAEDFKTIPEVEWDAYIRSISRFASWKDMMTAATGDLVKKRMGF